MKRDKKIFFLSSILVFFYCQHCICAVGSYSILDSTAELIYDIRRFCLCRYSVSNPGVAYFNVGIDKPDIIEIY